MWSSVRARQMVMWTVLALAGLILWAALSTWSHPPEPPPPTVPGESLRASSTSSRSDPSAALPTGDGAVANDFWTSRYGGDPRTAVALTCRQQMQGDVELTLAFDDDGVPTVPACSPDGPHCDCLHDHLEAGPRSPELAGRAAQLVVEGYPWSAAHEARLQLQLRLRRWFPDLSWALI